MQGVITVSYTHLDVYKRQPLQSPQNNWGTYGEEDSFNIFELSTNKDGGEMLKHMDLGEQSPVEVREAQSVNGPLAVLNEYYDVYVTQPERCV